MSNIPYNQIVVTGVPKSGTKLMAHMLHAVLPEWDYSVKEKHFWKADGGSSVITKHPHDIFAFKRLIGHLNTVPGHSGVVVMYRDPYYVLTSKHRGNDYWISAKHVGKHQRPPLDWFREIKNTYKKWGHLLRVFFCSYESLLEDPNLIGADILASFGFSIEHPAWKHTFSEYKDAPLSENESRFEFLKRPLETARKELTEKDLHYLSKQLEIEPKLKNIRKELGYE